MCFYLKSKSKPKIAEKSFTVYKVVRKLSADHCTSSIRLSLPYLLTKTYTAQESRNRRTVPIKELILIDSQEDLSPEEYLQRPYRYSIDEGFHSYISKEKAEYNLDEGDSSEVIVECRVPKNVPYYINKLYGECVSTKLKFIKFIEKE